jgi:ubiquinone/menaquinone biosynthesis C-methylase UbiE
METKIMAEKDSASSRDKNDKGFEEIYLEVRKKEQRFYTDKEVNLLPEISKTHVHYKEWQIRKVSATKLINYLKKKKGPLNVLEVGCGNGWLSSKLADIENATITGLDINRVELNQAASVFGNKCNLSFEYGDLRDGIFSNRKFDIIVFAASLQYFPSIAHIINAAWPLLSLKGEIHILDTPLYKASEILPAQQRCKNYYDHLGFPEMRAFYFHHPFSHLYQFGYTIMHNPFSTINSLLKKGSPFYWLYISKT